MEDWIYVGVFLTKESRELLLNKLDGSIPENWKIFADHCTICFNKHDENSENWANWAKDNEYKSIKFQAISLGINEKAMAVGVNGVFSDNKRPHVTIATSPIGKPVDSNGIEKWETIDSPIFLSGTIKFVFRKNGKR